mmetsp:Transcript_19447/g.40037  ORF Transcript_19447/g.40037 Transcript_19447/m.40037 type:complete len:288 (+) Transcript_19447:433-1296(+)
MASNPWNIASTSSSPVCLLGQCPVLLVCRSHFFGGGVHGETVLRFRIGNLVVFVFVFAAVVAGLVVFVFAVVFLVSLQGFLALFSQHLEPLLKGGPAGRAFVGFSEGLSVALEYPSTPTTRGSTRGRIGSIVVIVLVLAGRPSLFVVNDGSSRMLFFHRYANVPKGLGRLVHGPFVANVDVKPVLVVVAAVCVVVAAAALACFPGPLQEAPLPAVLSVPYGNNDLFHDRYLGSLRCRLVFVVVVFQQGVKENVSRVLPDALSPPAQNVQIGGSDGGVLRGWFCCCCC